MVPYISASFSLLGTKTFQRCHIQIYKKTKKKKQSCSLSVTVLPMSLQRYEGSVKRVLPSSSEETIHDPKDAPIMMTRRRTQAAATQMAKQSFFYRRESIDAGIKTEKDN